MTIVVEGEANVKGLARDSTVLEAAFAELLSKVIKDLDVVGYICGIVFRGDGNITKGLAVDDILSIVIAQLRRRPGE